MKKTHTKLQLKKSTIRVLQSADLKKVVGGGGLTDDPWNCSSSSCGEPPLLGWNRLGR